MRHNLFFHSGLSSPHSIADLLFDVYIFASICFFLVLLFVTTDRSYKRVSPLRRAFGILCFETCYLVPISFANLEVGSRSLRTERAFSFSQPIPNVIVLARSLEAHREDAISRADLSLDLFSRAKSIGKSGIAVVPKVSPNLPRNNATSNSSSMYGKRETPLLIFAKNLYFETII